MTMKTPRLAMKVHTRRFAEAGWELVMTIDEARRCDCLITLGDSQVLRWICEIRGYRDTGETDRTAKSIRREIRELRRQPDSRENRKIIERLYQQLDKELFIEDYLCLVADSKSDFDRACRKKGITLNGKKFVRLVGTSGGVKESTVVFVAADIAPELRRRIDNGRDESKELVPAKFEAYRGLTCSASLPVSMPHGVAVVPDCVTHFRDRVTYIDDLGDGEPAMTEETDMEIELDASDGYGLALPCLLERWGRELGMSYTPCACNTRYAWEKGVAVAFDFRRFGEEVAGGYIIKDVWGNDVDVREVELILTESMVKLWDSYESAEDYFGKSEANGYTFAVTKVAPEKLDERRNLNLDWYRFRLQECE